MNRKTIEKAVFPSSEEGWPRRFKNGSLPHAIGAAGEVRLSFQQVFDLPRCALSKVASRLFIGRIDPSSKEGKQPFSTFFPIHSHLLQERAPALHLRQSSKYTFFPSTAPTVSPTNTRSVLIKCIGAYRSAKSSLARNKPSYCPWEEDK